MMKVAYEDGGRVGATVILKTVPLQPVKFIDMDDIAPTWRSQIPVFPPVPQNHK